MEHFESLKNILKERQINSNEKLKTGEVFQLINEIIFEGAKINKKKIIKSNLE